ncbi:phospholipase D family protein [Comamonadaceae bacterium OTU4NAUVB1]|nr:phospholipase D family protein [Comamonadaceae bacterium OTU4NAUVB1]
MSPRLSLARSTSALRRLLVTLTLTAATAVVVGCAQLPTDVQRPVSTAPAPMADTPLATLVQAKRQAAGARVGSGFLLLGTPQSGYGSRLALVDMARRTLDLQYYAIHADASSSRLLGAVRGAARRGVRVRILLDDFHSTGRNALVMGLAFEPNVEMRMFNPLAGARGSALGRLFNSISDFDRVQQRMHNKLFVADNVMAVTGGRNLGDAYFGIAQNSNFIDLDVLAAGPVVRELSASFDGYWNDERAYPVQSLVSQAELREIHERTVAADVERRADTSRMAAGEAGAVPAQQEPSGGAPKLPDGEPRPSDAGPTDAQFAAAWDQQPMDLANVTFTWAPAVVLADKPAKIAAESGGVDGGNGSATADSGATPPAPAIPGGGGDTASAPSDGAGETVVDGLLQLIGQARHDLLVISPYFVPGPDMKAAFSAARARGVRVRVLTNSLASNDAPVAHVGYARHREELLAMGIELYEMRSRQAGLGSVLGASGSGSAGSESGGASRAMLHSKALVLDGRLFVIGSMNLDLRSQLQNTEIALLIRSPELSTLVTDRIGTVLREGAWRVEREDGRLVWRAPQGSGLTDARTEPDTSAGLRLLLKVFGPLAPDELL